MPQMSPMLWFILFFYFILLFLFFNILNYFNFIPLFTNKNKISQTSFKKSNSLIWKW